jgi:nucleoid DNA-binding protein
MLKDNQLLLMPKPRDLIKNGKSSILTRLPRLRLRDLMRNSDSISIDHSTLSLNFHSTELPRCTVTLKGGGRVSLVGFGSWSVSQRAARDGRNPQTGATIKIPAKKVVKFKAGAELSGSVN